MFSKNSFASRLKVGNNGFVLLFKRVGAIQRVTAVTQEVMKDETKVPENFLYS